MKDNYISTIEEIELRETKKYRKSIIEEGTRALNHLQKMLEEAIIKIISILAKVTYKTCMLLIEYVLNNEADIDENKTRELVTTNISTTIEEFANTMEVLLHNFIKTIMMEVIKYINELTNRIEYMNKILKFTLAQCKVTSKNKKYFFLCSISNYHMIKDDVEFNELGADFTINLIQIKKLIHI